MCQTRNSTVGGRKNLHAFFNLNDPLDMTVRSNKPKADVLIKWFSEKGMEKKIQEEHQQAIEEYEQAVALFSDDLQDRDKQAQDIKYEIVGLQHKIHAKD